MPWTSTMHTQANSQSEDANPYDRDVSDSRDPATSGVDHSRSTNEESIGIANSRALGASELHGDDKVPGPWTDEDPTDV